MLPRGYVHVNADRDRPAADTCVATLSSGGRRSTRTDGGSFTALPLSQQQVASPQQQDLSAPSTEHALLATYLVLWYATSAIWYVQLSRAVLW